MKMETTGSKNPADEMMDRLAEAAWKRLADTPPSALHIDDIALDAGVSASAARARRWQYYGFNNASVSRVGPTCSSGKSCRY